MSGKKSSNDDEEEGSASQRSHRQSETKRDDEPRTMENPGANIDQDDPMGQPPDSPLSPNQQPDMQNPQNQDQRQSRSNK